MKMKGFQFDQDGNEYGTPDNDHKDKGPHQCHLLLFLGINKVYDREEKLMTKLITSSFN